MSMCIVSMMSVYYIYRQYTIDDANTYSREYIRCAVEGKDSTWCSISKDNSSSVSIVYNNVHNDSIHMSIHAVVYNNTYVYSMDRYMRMTIDNGTVVRRKKSDGRVVHTYGMSDDVYVSMLDGNVSSPAIVKRVEGIQEDEYIDIRMDRVRLYNGKKGSGYNEDVLDNGRYVVYIYVDTSYDSVYDRLYNTRYVVCVMMSMIVVVSVCVCVYIDTMIVSISMVVRIVSMVSVYLVCVYSIHPYVHTYDMIDRHIVCIVCMYYMMKVCICTISMRSHPTDSRSPLYVNVRRSFITIYMVGINPLGSMMYYIYSRHEYHSDDRVYDANSTSEKYNNIRNIYRIIEYASIACTLLLYAHTLYRYRVYAPCVRYNISAVFVVYVYYCMYYMHHTVRLTEHLAYYMIRDYFIFVPSLAVVCYTIVVYPYMFTPTHTYSMVHNKYI